MPKNALKELDIKATILTQLRKERLIDKRTILTSEFLIGTSSLRADLAILNTEFIGVEVKSEFDTLRRLPHQLSGYRRLFDKVILVVADKHLPHLDSVDLHGVDVWRIAANGTLEFVASIPDDKKEQERTKLTSLLTKREIARSRIESLEGSAHEERSAFFHAFNERFALTSAAFWRAVERRCIRAQDLSLLSRFREQRILIERSINARKELNSMLAERWKNTKDAN